MKMFIPSTGEVLKIERECIVTDISSNPRTLRTGDKIKVGRIITSASSYTQLVVTHVATNGETIGFYLNSYEFNKIEAHPIQTLKNDTPIEFQVPYMVGMKDHSVELYVNFSFIGMVHYTKGTKRNTANITIEFNDKTVYQKEQVPNRDSIRAFVASTVNKHIPKNPVSRSTIEEELGL